MSNYNEVVRLANTAKQDLANSSIDARNNALKAISKALKENVDELLEVNSVDVKTATNITDVMKKRLGFTRDGIISMANDILRVSEFSDLVNETLETINRPNGLVIKKVRVPFGVILAIFESRPNVVSDIVSLSIKTGNVIILRGGKEALRTNKLLVKIIREAIKDYLPIESVNLIEETDHEIVNKLITMRGLIDLVVPRGSKRLIDSVVNNATVPAIETGAGVCHMYIDDEADLKMAVSETLNAKLTNPSVCNSLECILVNEKIAKEYFDGLKKEKFDIIVKVYGDSEVKKYINAEDVVSFDTEYNDYKINAKIVHSLDEAINHINTYGTKHSDAIITNSILKQEEFLNRVDSACVYVNASTRFSDGGCFGFGCELGISTGKMHARGPMGMKEMMTYKYKIYGNGQIR